MSDYQFFANFMNFVVQRADRSDPLVDGQMNDLQTIAGQVSEAAYFNIMRDSVPSTSRALAGFAGFLQEHILPEAVAHGHEKSEAQIRWVIDTTMAASTGMLAFVETQPEADVYRFDLPEPPN